MWSVCRLDTLLIVSDPRIAKFQEVYFQTHANNDTLYVMIRGLFSGIANSLIFARKIATKCNAHYPENKPES